MWWGRHPSTAETLDVEHQCPAARTGHTRIHDSQIILVLIAHDRVEVLRTPVDDPSLTDTADSFAAGSVDEYRSLLQRVKERFILRDMNLVAAAAAGDLDRQPRAARWPGHRYETLKVEPISGYTCGDVVHERFGAAAIHLGVAFREDAR